MTHWFLKLMEVLAVPDLYFYQICKKLGEVHFLLLFCWKIWILFSPSGINNSDLWSNIFKSIHHSMNSFIIKFKKGAVQYQRCSVSFWNTVFLVWFWKLMKFLFSERFPTKPASAHKLSFFSPLLILTYVQLIFRGRGKHLIR